MSKFYVKSLVFGAALFAFSLGFGQSGKELYKKHQCHTCHGETGDKPIATTYPKINGQNAAYALVQMKDIKTGKRKNGQSMAMQVLTKNISDKDLELIAKYLETLK